jgi:hypothetical protein
LKTAVRFRYLKKTVLPVLLLFDCSVESHLIIQMTVEFPVMTMFLIPNFIHPIPVPKSF